MSSLEPVEPIQTICSSDCVESSQVSCSPTAYEFLSPPGAGVLGRRAPRGQFQLGQRCGHQMCPRRPVSAPRPADPVGRQCCTGEQAQQGAPQRRLTHVQRDLSMGGGVRETEHHAVGV